MKFFSAYILSLIFLFSCNNSSVTVNQDKLLSADLSGDINFRFNSSKVNYILFETGEVEIYSEQLINPNEILTINIKFLYQNGLNKFNLSNLQNYRLIDSFELTAYDFRERNNFLKPDNVKLVKKDITDLNNILIKKHSVNSFLLCLK